MQSKVILCRLCNKDALINNEYCQECFNKSLTDVFSHIGNQIDAEQKEVFEKEKEYPLNALVKEISHDASRFEREIDKFNAIHIGFIKSKISHKHDVKFFLMNFNLISRQFRHIIEEVEGNCCCQDKNGAILHKLYHKLKDNKPIVMDEGLGFNRPTKVFLDEESIMEFYMAVKCMLYGQPETLMKIYPNYLNKK
jgi:hypothetical protein